MLRKNLDELDRLGQKGDWTFLTGRDYTYIAICYGDTAFSGTTVIPVSTVQGIPNVWFWDGNFESPTLSPSILVRKAKDRTEEWHGFLIDGKLVDA